MATYNFQDMVTYYKELFYQQKQVKASNLHSKINNKREKIHDKTVKIQSIQSDISSINLDIQSLELDIAMLPANKLYKGESKREKIANKQSRITEKQNRIIEIQTQTIPEIENEINQYLLELSELDNTFQNKMEDQIVNFGSNECAIVDDNWYQIPFGSTCSIIDDLIVFNYLGKPIEPTLSTESECSELRVSNRINTGDDNNSFSNISINGDMYISNIG